jgi:hypothetical protein
MSVEGDERRFRCPDVRISPDSGGIAGLLLGPIVARDCFGALDENARINSQSPANQAKYHDGAYPEAAPSGNAAQPTAPIFDSIAFWQLINRHE